MLNTENILITAIAIIFTLVTHEIAHGYIALLNGDDTAKNLGRLSPNPLKHLDPLGTLSMLLFRFGWAKPVPINPNKFKNYRLGMFTVSIAGIVVNLFTAFISIILLSFVRNIILINFLKALVSYGIIFAVFNLIPIPPLDGSKILASLLPIKFTNFMYKYQRYSSIVLIILLFSGAIDRLLIPIVNFTFRFLIDIVNFMGLLW